MSNNLFENVDVEAVSTQVLWNVEKARAMLEDVAEFFGDADHTPTKRDIDEIQMSFRTIYTKLGILSDMLRGIEDAVQPIEAELAAQKRKF